MTVDCRLRHELRSLPKHTPAITITAQQRPRAPPTPPCLRTPRRRLLPFWPPHASRCDGTCRRSKRRVELPLARTAAPWHTTTTRRPFSPLRLPLPPHNHPSHCSIHLPSRRSRPTTAPRPSMASRASPGCRHRLHRPCLASTTPPTLTTASSLQDRQVSLRSPLRLCRRLTFARSRLVTAASRPSPVHVHVPPAWRLSSTPASGPRHATRIAATDTPEPPNPQGPPAPSPSAARAPSSRRTYE